MRRKVKEVFPQDSLERLLEALEKELVAASDAEILEAAHELGMQPHMKGSAAFLGLRYPVIRALDDFFAVHVEQAALEGSGRTVQPRLPMAADEPGKDD